MVDHTDAQGENSGGAEGMARTAKPGLARAWAMAGARGLVGIIGIGIAAASIAAATLVPLPHFGVNTTSRVITPVAAPQQRICAGPVFQLGDSIGQDATKAISLGRAAVTRAATSGTLSLENMDATENESNVPAQRLVLAPPAAGEQAGLVAGSQSQSVSSADIAGFAASECVKPSAESWLVGGSTVTGRTTILSLNNPSKVSATVKLSIFSENGPVTAAGTDGIVVPPGGRQVFSLAAFAPGAVSPVVHVESAGGQVVATLQQSIVRTLTPGGIDIFSAGTDPSTLTVIPGVVIAGQNDITSASSVSGYADLTGTLRVLVPGKGSSEITVSAIPEDGSTPAHSSTLTIEGGIVTDFPLGEFANGTWTLTVASARPAVAAARTSTVNLQGVDTAVNPVSSANIVAADVAWFVGAPLLEKRALVSVAIGPSPTLHLVNLASGPVTVSIDAVDGAGKTVTVAAHEVLAVPVAGGVSYLLGGFESLRASVTYLGSGAIAGFVVSPPDRATEPVTVFSEYY